MKRNPDSFLAGARSRQRGIGTLEAIMVLIGLGVGWHLVASQAGRWPGSGREEARLEQLAETAVTISRQAELAGIQLVDPRDLDRTIDRLGQGETAKRGPFAGQEYVVRPFGDARIRERVKAYLQIEGGRLARRSDEE